MVDTSTLDADAIVNFARQQTGLNDFRHELFMPGLRAYVEALRTDAQLNDAGVEENFTRLVTSIANRLMADRLFEDKPEIREQALGSMVVITGLPRTGTTKLQRVLARHPDVRSIPFWQQLLPVPFDGDKSVRNDPRRQMIAGSPMAQFASDPEIAAIHGMGVDEPEEDAILLANTVSTATFSFAAHMPSYVAWQQSQDMAWVYEEFEDWLKLLQWQDDSIGRPWVLKNVLHTADIDHLLAQFPQARVVWPHRSPAQLIPSWCSLCALTRKRTSDDYDPTVLGQDILRYWSWAAQRAVIRRGSLPQDRFLDLDYRAIVNDIDDVLKGVLEHAGLPMSNEAMAAMRGWEEDNPQRRHAYALSDYGLDERQVRDAFEGYTVRFADWLPG